MASGIYFYSQFVDNQQFGIIVDINNSNCGYQQYELSISTIQITDINNCHLQQFELLMSTIRIVDINNSNVDINNCE